MRDVSFRVTVPHPSGTGVTAVAGTTVGRAICGLVNIYQRFGILGRAGEELLSLDHHASELERQLTQPNGSNDAVESALRRVKGLLTSLLPNPTDDERRRGIKWKLDLTGPTHAHGRLGIATNRAPRLAFQLDFCPWRTVERDERDVHVDGHVAVTFNAGNFAANEGQINVPAAVATACSAYGDAIGHVIVHDFLEAFRGHSKDQGLVALCEAAALDQRLAALVGSNGSQLGSVNFRY